MLPGDIWMEEKRCPTYVVKPTLTMVAAVTLDG